ncbi:hypothetical protein [Paramagnetospirillum magneticum]|uniref:Uncharacterized protein n=1 Tax=Paramagnetospirillum magneticum (strain ATCC 700264 / AMB-1) TaxID=342108 RepID=Q2W102_PARM1|nr:hypothetical protein [Paramagnetospirillum magneticum]BAE52473.1 hypothetical protein amb3669 [Paramagnetospirillum magneticum AMB-1]
MITNDKLSATSTTTDTQETAMNADQTNNSAPQPETENIVTSGNVIGDDIASSDDAGLDQRADLPAENADDAEGMSADEIEAALPGKQSYMDAASACEQAAHNAYLTDGRVASGEAEVWRLIYLTLTRVHAFYLAYYGTPDYDNYISSQGVNLAPGKDSKFGPLLKAVFGLGKMKAPTIKVSDALKGRMRTRLSKMNSALELAEERAKRDENGNIDVVVELLPIGWTEFGEV